MPWRPARAVTPPSALRSTRSPGRNTSGSRRARSATRSAVQGPTPGSVEQPGHGTGQVEGAVGDGLGRWRRRSGPGPPVMPTVRWRSAGSRAASTSGPGKAEPRSECQRLPGDRVSTRPCRGRRRAGPRTPGPRRATRAGRARRARRSRRGRCCRAPAGAAGPGRAARAPGRPRARPRPGAGSASRPSHRRPTAVAAATASGSASTPTVGTPTAPAGSVTVMRTWPGAARDEPGWRVEPSSSTSTSSSPGTACATRKARRPGRSTRSEVTGASNRMPGRSPRPTLADMSGRTRATGQVFE